MWLASVTDRQTSVQNYDRTSRHLMTCALIINRLTARKYSNMALLAGQQTCDSRVAFLIPGWASLRSGPGQATYTCVPLSPSSIIWYRPRGDLFVWESNHRPGGKQRQPTTGFRTKLPAG